MISVLLYSLQTVFSTFYFLIFLSWFFNTKFHSYATEKTTVIFGAMITAYNTSCIIISQFGILKDEIKIVMIGLYSLIIIMAMGELCIMYRNKYIINKGKPE